MKRRNFLKGILAAPAILAIPVVIADSTNPYSEESLSALVGSDQYYSRSDVAKLIKQRKKINAVITRRSARKKGLIK